MHKPFFLLLLISLSISCLNTNAQTSPAPTMDTLCAEVSRELDDMNGEIRIHSPLIKDQKMEPMILYKIITKGKSLYYLSFTTYGNTAVTDGTGVTVLFTDNTKWTKMEAIDVEAQSNGYEYNVYITLTQADIITFSTKKIKKFRLYIFDKEIDSLTGDRFKAFVKCIKSVK